MALSLAKAAEAAGVSKTTLRRAIHSGRLSAARLDDGSYEVEPAELHRAFPRPGDGSAPVARHGAASGTGELRVENEMLREQLALLKEQRDDLRAERDRLLGIVETQAQQVKLLTDDRPRRWRLWGRRR